MTHAYLKTSRVFTQDGLAPHTKNNTQMEGMELDSSGVPCLILRTTCRTGCVIQIQETGAIIEVELNTPLDLSRACLICAIHPVSAIIRLGGLKGNMFRNCELVSVDWPRQQEFAPPIRFQRKKRQDEARRTSGPTNGMQDIIDCQ